jgi:hypothetical protein
VEAAVSPVQNLGLVVVGRRFLMMMLMKLMRADYVDDYDYGDGLKKECRCSSGQHCLFALTKVKDDMNRATCLAVDRTKMNGRRFGR